MGAPKTSQQFYIWFRLCGTTRQSRQQYSQNVDVSGVENIVQPCTGEPTVLQECHQEEVTQPEPEVLQPGQRKCSLTCNDVMHSSFDIRYLLCNLLQQMFDTFQEGACIFGTLLARGNRAETVYCKLRALQGSAHRWLECTDGWLEP